MSRALSALYPHDDRGIITAFDVGAISLDRELQI